MRTPGRLWLRAALYAAAVSIAGFAAGQDARYTVARPFDWPQSSPDEQGVDSTIVDSALEAGESLPYLYSFLIVKNGVLIGERYYGAVQPTDAHTVMSVSKSLLSALVGLAQRKGFLDIDQRVMTFFPEYREGLDPRTLDITIRHLLTMTGGFPRDQYNEEWNRWMESPDWVGYCLNQELEDTPGESWRYSTCSTHIVSAILARATGMPTRRFARRHLFRPLGISVGGWPVDPQGVHRGGWDMFLAPRDVARFGQLYLERGKLEGARIVPRRWVRRTTRRNVSGTGSWGLLDSWGYGYWWWTGAAAEVPEIYFGLGYGGQFVVNVPSERMTIVATADGYVDAVTANDQEVAILGLILENLLRPLSETPGR